MKKQLLLTSALVAAGMIAANTASAQTAPASQPIQLTVGGYFEQSFGYTSNKDGVATSYRTSGAATDAAGTVTLADPNKFGQMNDSEIWFMGKTTLANGISVALRVELEANSEADPIDESFLAIEGAFGRFEMGSTDEAGFKTHVSVPGIGKAYSVEQSTATSYIVPPTANTRVGGDRTSTIMTADQNKISYYTPRFEGLQVGVSFTPNSVEDLDQLSDKRASRTNVVGAGANFTRAFGGANVEASLGASWADAIDGATAGTANADDLKHYTAGLRVSYAGFTVGGGYKKQDDGVGTGDGNAWSIGLSYQFGPATVGIQHFSSKVEGTATAGEDKYRLSLLGANYTLGPGVDLFGNIFTIKYTDESSSAAADNNKGSAGVGGVRLSF